MITTTSSSRAAARRSSSDSRSSLGRPLVLLQSKRRAQRLPFALLPRPQTRTCFFFTLLHAARSRYSPSVALPPHRLRERRQPRRRLLRRQRRRELRGSSRSTSSAMPLEVPGTEGGGEGGSRRCRTRRGSSRRLFSLSFFFLHRQSQFICIVFTLRCWESQG